MTYIKCKRINDIRAARLRYISSTGPKRDFVPVLLDGHRAYYYSMLGTSGVFNFYSNEVEWTQASREFEILKKELLKPFIYMICWLTAIMSVTRRLLNGTLFPKGEK